MLELKSLFSCRCDIGYTGVPLGTTISQCANSVGSVTNKLTHRECRDDGMTSHQRLAPVRAAARLGVSKASSVDLVLR